MSLPPVSVLICSRNRRDLLNDTVHSVLSGNDVPNELVIVDQSETFNTVLAEMKLVRGCEVRYCWSQSVGVSVARNIAIQMAHYDLLAITDDDVFVQPDWLSILINGLIHAGTDCVVSGKVLISKTADGDFATSEKVDNVPAIYHGRIQTDALWTGNMAMHRSVIRDVGLFDERLGPGSFFPAAEDNDYGFRILEAGYRIFYLPSAVVYHKAWRQEREYLPLRWKYGVGRGGFYAKYINVRDRYSFDRMVRDILNHLLAFPYDFRHERLKAYGDLVLAAGILVGVCRWLVRYGPNSLMPSPSLNRVS